MNISGTYLPVPTLAVWRARLAGAREFFAYHGVWAPGVRLLRQLTVRVKISLVLGVIAAPLLPLTVHVVAQENATVAASQRRLTGLHLAAAAYDLSASANAILSRDLAAGPLSTGAASPAINLAADYRRLLLAVAEAERVGLDVRPQWERSRPVLQRIAAVVDLSPDKEELVQVRQTAFDLHDAVAQAAGIRVTSDRELQVRAELALEELPQLQVELARLHSSASRLAAADGLPPAERHAVWTAAAVQTGRVALQLETTAEALHGLPGGASVAAAALDPIRAYLEQIRSTLSTPQAVVDMAAIKAAFAPARQSARKLRVELLRSIENTLNEQRMNAERLRSWVFGALLGSLTLALYLLYTFFLVMRGGLVQLNQQMTRMAEGDLSARLTPLGVDEVAMTMQAMTASLVRLSDLLASVRHGVGAVSHAAQQVAHGNSDLTSRNRDTTQGLSAVVDGVARYAKQLEACGRQVESVVATVQALRLESARNRRQMQRLRERMSELRGKSREIGEIVTLIDVIAFRTNILALNASVEASKAGDAGRGFAVVAQEVRSLALRGADSARRIGEIVARSTDDIELSSALAEETGNALAVADQQVDQIHVAMDDVAALSRSGGKESAEILQQLTMITAATAKDLDLVEQLAAASQALRSQGERLAYKVAQFKLS
jgi:methyl-accepting chemotaxis protein